MSTVPCVSLRGMKKTGSKQAGLLHAPAIYARAQIPQPPDSSSDILRGSYLAKRAISRIIADCAPERRSIMISEKGPDVKGFFLIFLAILSQSVRKQRLHGPGVVAETVDRVVHISLRFPQRFAQIQAVSVDGQGYVEEIQIGTASYSGEEVEYALGLASPAFTLEDYGGNIRAVVKGIGHGCGLSQYGARKRADEGWTAEEIIEYFYPGAEVVDGEE